MTLCLVPVFGESRLVEGNSQSPVRVVIFEDLQCSDCAVFRVMLDKQILPRYAAKVAFEHRDFPLPKHNWARKAAIASRFFEAIKPELAVEYRRTTMAQQSTITAENFNEKLAAFAKTHAADPEKALASLADKSLASLVEQDYQDAVARGVGKTPTVLVDGEPFIENFSFQEVSASLDRALQSMRVH
jgi:protein-disulfide isomerase